MCQAFTIQSFDVRAGDLQPLRQYWTAIIDKREKILEDNDLTYTPTSTSCAFAVQIVPERGVLFSCQGVRGLEFVV
jgi:hypothetical protein